MSLPRAYREAAVGDLAQEYGYHVVPAQGRRAARRWYAAQVLGSIGPAWSTRLRNPVHSLSTPSNKENPMAGTWQDVRYAIRSLWHATGFSTVVVVTLAFGIGANAAMFSVLNAIMLRPLDYPRPGELVRIRELRNGNLVNVSPVDFLDVGAATQTLSHVATYTAVGAVTVTRPEGATRVPRARVGAAFFRALEVRPQSGRVFLDGDDAVGADPVAVVSAGYAQRMFEDAARAVGQTLTLDDRTHVVVGVLPPQFRFAAHPAHEQAEIWTPLVVGPRSGRGGHWAQAVGRLAPGVSQERAQEELSAIASRLEAEYPRTNTGHQLQLTPLHASVVAGAERALFVLMGAVTLVLLIACANVANLLLARGTGRQDELALRAALGAGRARLARQLLFESGVLALSGGAAGLVLAGFVTDALAASAQLPRSTEIGLDPIIVAYTLVVSIASALVFGTIPTIAALRRVRIGSNRRGGWSSAPASRWQDAFIGAQLALTCTLLVSAGLMIKSFARLAAVDSGVDASNVAAIELVLPNGSYTTLAEIGAFYRDFPTDVEALPGVRAVGAVNNIPFKYDSCDGFRLPDRPDPRPGEGPCAYNQLVTPGYAAATGIRMIEGREFVRADGPDARPVIMINETFARRFWPGQSALGKTVAYNGVEREVVGVTASVRRLGLAVEPEPEMMIPHLQESWDRQMFLIVRADVPVETLVPAVRSLLRDRDPTVPIGEVEMVSRMIASTIATPRLRAILLGSFAGMALALAMLGVYAVIAYVVTARTREIGLRVALGARADQVARLFVGRAARITGAALAVGLGASLAATRALRGLLFEVGPLDPAIFVAAGGVLGGVALVAAYWPSRRALAVDPVVALRYDG